MRSIALLAVAAGLVAGCGSGSSGQATVWITRDHGTHVLRSADVPAGLTAAQGLERVAEVRTRYGGRYVQAVDGLAESGNDAWFYYVNGYLADRSAAEYKLRAGDVEWWDYRGWSDPAQNPVVIGAFPEPFLHGYGGKRRPAVVVSAPGALARRVARLVGTRRVVAGAPRGVNVLELVRLDRPRFFAALRSPGAGAPVRFVLDVRLARRLLARPSLARRRYALP